MMTCSQHTKPLKNQRKSAFRAKGMLLAGIAVMATEIAASKGIFPDISMITSARADDDDGGGFRGGGFRGGGGIRMRGISLPIGIPRIRLGRLPKFAVPRKRYRKYTKARAVPVEAVPRRSRSELIVAGLTPTDISTLQGQGFNIRVTRTSETLGQTVSRVDPPAGLGATKALERIEAVAPGSTAARNDVFQRSAIGPYKAMGEACGAGCEAFVMTGWKSSYLQCELPEVIGVIDTGVDPAHPSLTGANVELASVRRPDRRPSDPAHGTGVVSLLVGQPGSDVVGVLPKAKIIAVDAFHRSGKSDATDAFDLVAALDLLAERDVRIVNLSLAGPQNAVLADAVAKYVDRGATLIAAAGPSSDKSGGYPAKYPGVIAVAAIDGEMRPSRLSARGTHIAYAGPGVGMTVASPGGKARLATGTSFAAPIVSAAFASAKSDAGGDSLKTVQTVQNLAKDLGAPGRDPVYGWGLVQFPAKPGC
jgi:hypothetical protein